MTKTPKSTAGRSLKKFKALVIIILVFILGLFLWWQAITAPIDKTNQTAQIFVIPKGQTIAAIADRLYNDKLIRSQVAFKLIIFKDNLSHKIQAGDFRLRPSMDLEEIANSFTHGTLDLWVTFLEGWRREEIARELNLDFTPQDFIQATQGQEGYLFPDTYLFAKGASAQTVASVLENTFKQKVDFSTNKSALTNHQVVILASILEREVRTDKDRNLVAGILLKRLKNNWPLQADATVQYIKGTNSCSLSQPQCDWWPQVYPNDLKNLKSPYNTYLNQGLPPNPISNPGLASINAVLNPKTSAYWYYISDASGNIHYAKTIEEHNANISRYLR